jgi:hypothetical protein
VKIRTAWILMMLLFVVSWIGCGNGGKPVGPPVKVTYNQASHSLYVEWKPSVPARVEVRPRNGPTLMWHFVPPPLEIVDLSGIEVEICVFIGNPPTLLGKVLVNIPPRPPTVTTRSP